MKIEKEPDNPNKLRLAINEINIVDWFRQKYKEVQQRVVGNTHQVSPESKGFKL